VVQIFRWAQPCKCVVAYGDSDCAGDRKSRKSTSGGVISWAGHVLKSWGTTQQTIAMSSGEAELYAITRAETQLTGRAVTFRGRK